MAGNASHCVNSARCPEIVSRAKIGASPERDILAFLIMKVKVK